MRNKKGAEMTIGTIIVIILALVVLVILIYGFSTGWGNLWDKLIGYGGGKVNVQTVVDGCNIACTTSASYDYCTKKQKVVFDANSSSIRNKQEYTCKALEYQGVGLSSCGNVDCLSQGGGCELWDGFPASTGTCPSDHGEMSFASLTGQGLVCCIPKKTCEAWGGHWTKDENEKCLEGDLSDSYVREIVISQDFSVEGHNFKCCIPQTRA